MKRRESFILTSFFLIRTDEKTSHMTYQVIITKREKRAIIKRNYLMLVELVNELLIRVLLGTMNIHLERNH